MTTDTNITAYGSSLPMSLNNRLRDILLCFNQEYVPWSVLKDSLPLDTGVDEVKLCLAQDPFNMFSYIEDIDNIIEPDNIIGSDGHNGIRDNSSSSSNLLIGLKNVTIEVQLIQKSIEKWRQMILQQLIECDGGPVEFSTLPAMVPRPTIIPTSVKIKDVLTTDLKKSFNITCNDKHDLWLVSLSQLNSDVQSIFEEKWKSDIAHFLYKQSIQIPLTRLGIEVPRPTNLHQKKLSEVLRSDVKQRFVLVPNPTNNETFVQVHMTTTQREKYCEKWRRAIIHFITSSKQKYLYLNILAANVQRPYMGCNVIIGNGVVKLKKILVDDPQSRFKLTGELNKIKVSLSLSPSLQHKSEVR
jgi:hypothetical protein